jgi:hypothetical protein
LAKTFLKVMKIWYIIFCPSNPQLFFTTHFFYSGRSDKNPLTALADRETARR